MQWRHAVTNRAKERAYISFFIFIMFFAVFGVIILTELLLLEKPNSAPVTRVRYSEEPQLVLEPQSPITPQDGVWQPVSGTRFKFFVYSAYMEKRTVPSIRIIAATKTRGPDKVLCRLFMPDNRTITLKANVKTIRENWNLNYSASYVLCLLANSGILPQDTVGATISVLAAVASKKPHTNMLTILDTESKADNENTLHVCVKPFHTAFSRVDWLMEWVELNRLLGVSHFYLYKKSLSGPVACLLEHYQRQGLVTMLGWKLPFVSKIEIRTEGLFAAFNDCLYRSMSSADWLMVIDVDEIILPKRKRTLPAFISLHRTASSHPKKPPSAYLFRNAFFYMQWEDDPQAPVPLVTARKTRRCATPHPLKTRSKYIVKPRHAVELGNHFIWELTPGHTSIGVPANRALVHHYRIACESVRPKCLQVPSTVDWTAHRWAEELLQNITSQKNKRSKTCFISAQP